jgi:hypothetical protein
MFFVSCRERKLFNGSYEGENVSIATHTIRGIIRLLSTLDIVGLKYMSFLGRLGL